MKSPFWRSPWWHVYHIYSKPPWTSWPVDFSTFLVNAMRDKPIIWCPRIPSQNLQKMQRGLLWPHPIVTLMRKFIGLHPHFNGWLNPFWPHMKETPDVKKKHVMPRPSLTVSPIMFGSLPTCLIIVPGLVHMFFTGKTNQKNYSILVKSSFQIIWNPIEAQFVIVKSEAFLGVSKKSRLLDASEHGPQRAVAKTHLASCIGRFFQCGAS